MGAPGSEPPGDLMLNGRTCSPNREPAVDGVSVALNTIESRWEARRSHQEQTLPQMSSIIRALPLEHVRDAGVL